MYFSFMMVRTENHSGGTKYTFNPRMTTNTRHLQRICPVLRRSSLRCLLPSVYGLMGFPQRHPDLSLKRPEPGLSARVQTFCIRLIKLWNHRSARTGAHDTPGVCFHTFSVTDLYEFAWTVDPRMRNGRGQKVWPPPPGRDGGQNWTVDK